MLLIWTICYVFRYEVLILQRAPHTHNFFFFLSLSVSLLSILFIHSKNAVCH